MKSGLLRTNSRRRLRLTLALSTLFAIICCPATAAEWKPTKSIELIVPTTPGSGVDNTARTIQLILQNRKLVAEPVAVINKGGGGNNVAMGYLGQFDGDGHRLLVQTSTALTGYITGTSPFNYFELTPIANLISEPIVFIVRADSAIKSGKDFVDRLKADPSALSIAFASARGNAFHIAAALVARGSGIDMQKLKVVIYNASGDAVSAALGGHVDITLATSGNVLSLLEAKTIRIIAIASPERLTGPLAQVPTWGELGHDVVVDLWRGVLGPRKLPQAEIAYWDDVFHRLTQTDEWRQNLERNHWVNAYKNSADTTRELKAQYALLKGILVELGMAK